MNKPEFVQLIDKYLAGNASTEEEQLLLNFFDSFQSGTEWDDTQLGLKQQLEDKMLKRLQGSVRAKVNADHKKIIRLPFLKYAAAAIVAITFITTAVLYTKQPAKKQIVTNHKPVIKYDAEPGSNKAVLTLANGSKLVLDAAKNGLLAKSGHISIKKAKDGQLIYLIEGAKNTATNAPTVYNTISTPIGGQYQVILPDGTKVWLNAASSLRYPTSFTGKQRMVELTGEAYFEVTKNAAMPFNVHVNKLDVKVLGTHFNIMAYGNEPVVKTTLLEGSVQLNSGQTTNTLKPGQQGVLNSNNEIKVFNVDAEHYIAWKNGYFDFKRSSIREIMNQLARWYDVDVVYSGNIPDDEFVGKIQRSAKLSEVLHILELSKVNFKIEQKKIIVKS